jgi:hypothetical protein
MQSKGWLLNVVNNKPPTSTCQIFSGTNFDFQYGIICMRINVSFPCTSSMRTAQLPCEMENSWYLSLLIPTNISCQCLVFSLRWLHNQILCNVEPSWWAHYINILDRHTSTFTGGCVRACASSTTVPLSVLHVKHTTNLTSFWMDELGMVSLPNCHVHLIPPQGLNEKCYAMEV